jgi:hypothetical protein
MNTPYTLASDSEPTEKQLAELMHEVAVEARQRAQEANKKLLEDLKKAVADAWAIQKQWEEKKP